MPTPHYDLVLKALQAEGEISQLQYDIQNSPPAMKEITVKLFNVVTSLTFHVVALTEELLRLNVLQRRQQSPAPAAKIASTHTFSPFPSPPVISLPRVSSPSGGAVSAPTEIAPSNVPQVVITSSGTKVIPPAGSGFAPVSLPPNVPVNLANVQAPAVPVPSPDGTPQVVLPRGGAMSPEVQAALASRQGPET